MTDLSTISFFFSKSALVFVLLFSGQESLCGNDDDEYLKSLFLLKKTRHPIYEKNLNCFFEKGLTRPLCVCFCSFQTTFNRKMSTLAGFELGSLE